MIKASVSKSLSRSNKILMTDLVSTKLQAPAHGNVPSHPIRLLLEERHVPDERVKKDVPQ